MAAQHHDSLTLHQTGTAPHRPGHQLRRSITEQPGPFKHHRVHHYLHRRINERDDRMPLSAGSELRGSLELPRTEDAPPSAATEAGRIAFWGDDDAPNIRETMTSTRYSGNQNGTAGEQITDVEAAAAYLKMSLTELNNSRIATSARLDAAYSSILNRIGSLQESITALKELAVMSEEITQNFSRESRALESEIESQVSIYEQTEDQKRRIEHFEARIHAVRDKVNKLSKRVDAIRERIESWERADKEWQERTRKRLKILWIIISAIALVLMFLFLGTQYSSATADPEYLPEMGLRQATVVENLVANSSKSASAMAEEIREELARKRSQGTVEEGVLRVFDEL